MGTVVKMSAGGENGSANGKRGGGGAMEPWQDGEGSKEPARRSERRDIAAKIAKVSEELKQDVRPPPPAVIAVGGVNEAKAYVPAIVPTEQASPEEDSQRVRVADPRQARTEQLDRAALLEASRRGDAAGKVRTAESGEAVERPLAPARIYWIAIGVAIGLGVVVVPLLWVLWRAPVPRPLGVPGPGGTAEVLPPVVSSVPGLASGEPAAAVVDTASASPAPSAAPESTAMPAPSAAPSVTPAAMPSVTPAVKPAVKPAAAPSASPTTLPSSAPTGIPTEMVN